MIKFSRTKKSGSTKAERNTHQIVNAGHNIPFSEQEVKTQKVQTIGAELFKKAQCLPGKLFCGNTNTSNKASRVFWQKKFKTNFVKLLREFRKNGYYNEKIKFCTGAYSKIREDQNFIFDTERDLFLNSYRENQEKTATYVSPNQGPR